MVFENCGNCIAMEQSGYIIYIVSKRTVWEAKIMKKITSAYANKMLRSLEEDKAFWVNKEAASSTYVAAVNEEPVIPEYDYMTIANTIDEIDRKIVTIKHTLNLTNATAKVQVGNQEMSIDSILIRMAQLNKRKAVPESYKVPGHPRSGHPVPENPKNLQICRFLQLHSLSQKYDLLYKLTHF